jgi:hypothetical protein
MTEGKKEEVFGLEMEGDEDAIDSTNVSRWIKTGKGLVIPAINR